MKNYTANQISEMTIDEINTMLEEFEERLCDKNTQIDQLKGSIKYKDNLIEKKNAKISMLQAMIQGIVDNEF
ncbi:MAG TPA: hypothetical protein DCE23_04285 [Firmicutes bacterium]|nr:hypothetical protein [Bacillota bacterium]